MQYFFEPELQNGTETLNEDESAHCIKVFRHREGDNIGLLDGHGGIYQAIIKKANPKQLSFEIINKKIVPSPSYKIHLAIAPTKNSDRMEWLVEKLTEIGVTEISLIFTQNSERRKYRTDRLHKKVIGAIKQSKNPFLPVLHEPVDLNNFLTIDAADQKFIAFVDSDNPHHLKSLAISQKKYSVLIGPEGDFTREELKLCSEKGYRKVTLGENVLRTETAGFVAVNTLHLINTL